MLTLCAGQAESLWDEALPVCVQGLPEDLAGLDRLLSDPALLVPIVAMAREVERRRCDGWSPDRSRWRPMSG